MPYIPKKYTHVEGSVDTGFVIEDSLSSIDQAIKAGCKNIIAIKNNIGNFLFIYKLLRLLSIFIYSPHY